MQIKLNHIVCIALHKIKMAHCVHWCFRGYTKHKSWINLWKVTKVLVDCIVELIQNCHNHKRIAYKYEAFQSVSRSIRSYIARFSNAITAEMWCVLCVCPVPRYTNEISSSAIRATNLLMSERIHIHTAALRLWWFLLVSAIVARLARVRFTACDKRRKAEYEHKTVENHHLS